MGSVLVDEHHALSRLRNDVIVMKLGPSRAERKDFCYGFDFRRCLPRFKRMFMAKAACCSAKPPGAKGAAVPGGSFQPCAGKAGVATRSTLSQGLANC